MHKPRLSIAELMAFVLVAAIGMAALRYASLTWAGVMFLLTCGVLTFAVVGAACNSRKAAGVVARFRTLRLGIHDARVLRIKALIPAGPFLPTTRVLAFLLRDKVGPRRMIPAVPRTSIRPALLTYPTTAPGQLATAPKSPGVANARIMLTQAFAGTGFPGGFGALSPLADAPFFQVGHCLWALLFGALGGLLSRQLVAATDGGLASRDLAASSPPGVQPPQPQSIGARPRRHTHAAIGLPGLSLTSVALAALWSESGLLADAMFLLTCGLLGVAVLGAVFARGRAASHLPRRRAIRRRLSRPCVWHHGLLAFPAF